MAAQSAISVGVSSSKGMAYMPPLQRLRRIEIGARDIDPACNKLGEKARPHAGRLEMTLDGAVGGGTGAHVFVDVLHLQDVAFEAGDLRDRRYLALAVGEALQLHDDADRRRDLAAR